MSTLMLNPFHIKQEIPLSPAPSLLSSVQLSGAPWCLWILGPGQLRGTPGNAAGPGRVFVLPSAGGGQALSTPRFPLDAFSHCVSGAGSQEQGSSWRAICVCAVFWT